MGRKRIELAATASLSAHNDYQDDVDAQLWNRFVGGGLLMPDGLNHFKEL